MLCIKCQEAEENKESGFCDNCEKKKRAGLMAYYICQL
jgi:hypothetical protein